jgi:hypothetical protein
MTKQTVTPSSPLFSSTATIAFKTNNGNQAPTIAQTDRTQGNAPLWAVERAGREGHEVNVIRYHELRNGLTKVMIDLGFANGGEMRGILVLPPSIKVSDGVRFQIDNGDLTHKIPIVANSAFRCVAKLHFKGTMVEQLKSARFLNIYATATLKNKKIVFSIPLTGFEKTVQSLAEMRMDKTS